MIPQLEKPIEYLQNVGYAHRASMVLLAEYYKQRSSGVTADEATSIIFDYIASGMNNSEDIYAEVKSFHKRLCRKGYKPEQVAEVVEAYYSKEE